MREPIEASGTCVHLAVDSFEEIALWTRGRSAWVRGAGKGSHNVSVEPCCALDRGLNPCLWIANYLVRRSEDSTLCFLRPVPCGEVNSTRGRDADEMAFIDPS